MTLTTIVKTLRSGCELIATQSFESHISYDVRSASEVESLHRCMLPIVSTVEDLSDRKITKIDWFDARFVITTGTSLVSIDGLNASPVTNAENATIVL